MTCRACVFQHTQVPLADESPTATAIPNKFHHINTALLEFWKIEVSLDTPQGTLIIIISLLTRGCQTIQINGGIDRV